MDSDPEWLLLEEEKSYQIEGQKDVKDFALS